ncbi:MAG: hypothetical protein IJ493_12220, partial [Clostridia bacterium]|nr:hypothetical protein [Clostridia bacterium]
MKTASFLSAFASVSVGNDAMRPTVALSFRHKIVIANNISIIDTSYPKNNYPMGGVALVAAPPNAYVKHSLCHPHIAHQTHMSNIPSVIPTLLTK